MAARESNAPEVLVWTRVYKRHCRGGPFGAVHISRVKQIEPRDIPVEVLNDFLVSLHLQEEPPASISGLGSDVNRSQNDRAVELVEIIHRPLVPCRRLDSHANINVPFG